MWKKSTFGLTIIGLLTFGAFAFAEEKTVPSVKCELVHSRAGTDFSTCAPLDCQIVTGYSENGSVVITSGEFHFNARISEMKNAQTSSTSDSAQAYSLTLQLAHGRSSTLYQTVLKNVHDLNLFVGDEGAQVHCFRL